MNKMEIPEMNTSIYSKLIFNKGANGSQWRKDNPFNKCCLEIVYSHSK